MDLEKKKENKNKLQRSVLNKRKQKNYKTYIYYDKSKRNPQY